MTEIRPGPLNHLRVVDLGDLRTALGVRLLGELGADVVKIEPVSGDPTRRMAPLLSPEGGQDRSAVFLSRNAGKRLLAIDLNTEQGRDDLCAWIRGADLLFESFAPGYLESIGLSHEVMRTFNPRLVACSVTDWGLTGPRAGLPGAPLVALAASGALQVCGPSDRPPCNAPGPIAYDSAAIYGALGALLAAFERGRDGVGRSVEVSVQESSLAAMFPWSIPTYSYNGEIPARGGASLTVYPCRDGYVRMLFASDRHWKAIVDILGRPESLSSDEWKDRAFRSANIDIVRQLISEQTRKRTVEELLDAAHRMHIPSAALRRPAELLADPNIVGRRFFRSLEIAGENRQIVSEPFRIVGEPLPEPTPPRTVTGPWMTSTPREDVAPSDAPGLPFAGMRVVSCCIGAVGPEMSRFLGDFGADVIKIESALHPETMRLVPTLPAPPDAPFSTGAGFNDANRGKRSVTVDLASSGGREILHKLIAQADILVENYRGDVARSWGLDFEELRRINPSLLYVSSQGFGRGGPAEKHSMMGPNLAPSIGCTYLWGYPEEDPPAGFTLNFPDHIAGKIGLMALLAIMLRRQRTGGRSATMIDLSQAESGALFIAEHFLTIDANHSPERVGNSGRGNFAPHGVYPSAGIERWIAISVGNDAQWASLCRILGAEGLANDPRFNTHAGRVENEREIDEAVAQFTSNFEPHGLMNQLLAAGVPASAVMRADDHLNDEHLLARQVFVEIDHPTVGRRVHIRGDAMHIDGLRPLADRRAPLMGEHTDEVMREWLGLDDTEIAALRASGTIGV